jgi:hypothetical protein
MKVNDKLRARIAELESQLKSEMDLNWTSSLCDRVNQILREHPVHDEVKNGSECSSAIAAIHGYCGHLKSQNNEYSIM